MILPKYKTISDQSVDKACLPVARQGNSCASKTPQPVLYGPPTPSHSFKHKFKYRYKYILKYKYKQNTDTNTNMRHPFLTAQQITHITIIV